MGFLSECQLKAMGFKHIGKEVKLSEKASIYNPGAISIGDYSRIDDFCILSAGAGGIQIGRNVHIGCYCSLIGQSAIILEDYTGVSGRTAIYSSSDDFTGAFMTNPTVPSKYTNVRSAPVILRKHALVGSGSTLMPGVEVGEGAVLGTMSLALKNLEPYGTYFGIPAKKIGERKTDLRELEQQFLHETTNPG